MIKIIFIAVALAMDAVTVSISTVMNSQKVPAWLIIRMAFFFGFFQAAMPLLGWLLGYEFRELIQDYDHWIAFGLLSIIGIKMIIDTYDSEECLKTMDYQSLKLLVILSIATSVDAMASGVSFCFLNIDIVPASAMIGLITFGLCLPAGLLGKKLGLLFGKKMELIGGIVLIGVGAHILFDHILTQ